MIFPGGFGTLDELFEALTLIQTGKVLHFPVVLFDSEYWRPLQGWIHDRLLPEGLISSEDLELSPTTRSGLSRCCSSATSGVARETRPSPRRPTRSNA